MRDTVKKFFALLVLLALSVCQITNAQNDTIPSVLVPYCNYDKLMSNNPIEEEYISSDVDVITNKVNQLEAAGKTISGIQKILPRFIEGTECNCRSFTRDLGYGLRETEHTFFGGTGTYTASALYFSDHVIQLRLTISFPYRNSFHDRIVNAIKLPFDCINGIIAYEKVYDSNFRLYNDKIGHLFISSSDTNERRKEAINYFTNVLAGWPPLKRYGSGNSFLAGAFDNLRYFIANKDSEALEQILYCPDLNSRVLAARTLIYLMDLSQYRPSSIIKKRIDKTILKAEVITVYPDMSFVGERGKRQQYDLVKDFEKYLKEQ